MDGDTRIWIDWTDGADLFVTMTPDEGPTGLGVTGLSEDDLIQLDEEHSIDNYVEIEGDNYRYRTSSEVTFFRDCRGPGESFYQWDFLNEDGDHTLSITKGEGRPFEAVFSEVISPDGITLYKGSRPGLIILTLPLEGQITMLALGISRERGYAMGIMIESFIDSLQAFPRGLVFVAEGLIVLALAKFAKDAVTRHYRVDEEVTTKGNLAMALRLSGYFIAIILIFLGVLVPAVSGWWVVLVCRAFRIERSGPFGIHLGAGRGSAASVPVLAGRDRCAEPGAGAVRPADPLQVPTWKRKWWKTRTSGPGPPSSGCTSPPAC